jgi:hypothetical protein
MVILRAAEMGGIKLDESNGAMILMWGLATLL